MKMILEPLLKLNLSKIAPPEWMSNYTSCVIYFSAPLSLEQSSKRTNGGRGFVTNNYTPRQEGKFCVQKKFLNANPFEKISLGASASHEWYFLQLFRSKLGKVVWCPPGPACFLHPGDRKVPPGLTISCISISMHHQHQQYQYHQSKGIRGREKSKLGSLENCPAGLTDRWSVKSC